MVSNMVKLERTEPIQIDLPVLYSKTHYSMRAIVRDRYIEQQKGLCHFCKATLEGKPAKKIRKLKVDKTHMPRHFYKYPVHLHHCHKTDLTIGAVHAHCNAVLWQYYGE